MAKAVVNGSSRTDDPCEASTLPRGTIIDAAGFAASGGGYRAMLFHIGSLWRLNELGWLGKIDRFSGVSGGSLTIGALAVAWQNLRFDPRGVATNFEVLVANPVLAMARVRLDLFAIVRGLVRLGSGADVLAGAYRRHLVGTKTLQDLPDRPRFTFNTTSVQTGADFRFTKRYMRDYRVGCLPYPTVALAYVLAASSSFPPFLSPYVMKLREPLRPGAEKGFDDPRYRRRLVLSDGGVYDNLGLQPIASCRTIIASDGGSPGTVQAAPSPFWLWHAKRVADLAIEEARRQRRYALVQEMDQPAGTPTKREGTIWKIDTKISSYRAPTVGPKLLAVDDSQARSLASVGTRLWPLGSGVPERLVNLGYALSDAGLRSRMELTGPDPAWPYPAYDLSAPVAYLGPPIAGASRDERA